MWQKKLSAQLERCFIHAGLSVARDRIELDLKELMQVDDAAERLSASGLEYGFRVDSVVVDCSEAWRQLGGASACVVMPLSGDFFALAVTNSSSGVELRVLLENGLQGDVYKPESIEFGATVLLISVTESERWQDEVRYRSKSPHWWFVGQLLAQRSAYLHVLLASAMLSVLAILSTFFTMNVYDRVVPNNAFSTLWVLAGGVVVAYAFEFLLKEVRGILADSAAKRIDVTVSGVLFSKVLNMQLLARPASSGAMAAHLREFEGVRDFFTSLSVLLLLDLPFFWVYVALMFYIGGAVVLVPVLAIPLVLIVLYMIQAPMAQAVERSSATSVQKQGLLIEAINGHLDIKSLGAEKVLRRLWDVCSLKSASESNKARYWSSFGVNFAGFVQQLVQVGVVIVGVYAIARGDLTMGGLIACGILNGRLMAPLGQMVSLGVRAQQTYQSIQTLSRIMEKPEDRQVGRRYISPVQLAGSIELRKVDFRYRQADSEPAIAEISLSIRAGERVAIVGRTGCGKSTLLKVIAGLLESQAGAVYLGSRDVRQIDPARLRQLIAYVPQAPVLLSGTIRENLCMGRPHADDEELLAAARVAVLDDHIARHPQGYDRQVGESGGQLSGGQKQCLAIARAFLGDPAVILLDEPTSAMDSRTEEEFRSRFLGYAEGRTVVLVTHKSSMLDMVDRIIVMDQGRILSDTSKDDLKAAMKRMASGVVVSKGEAYGHASA